MSHLSLRTLIEDVAKSLSDKVQFGYGRRSEFNAITNKRYPYIWLLPLTASRRYPGVDGTKTKLWNVALVFLDLDKADSNEKQTAKIHDELDVMVDRFLESLDTWDMRSEDVIGSFEITNDNQQPFFKDDTDINSGWLLTLQVELSDDFDYCRPEYVNLYGDI